MSKKPFDLQDWDTYPTEAVEPTPLQRLVTLPLTRMLEEEDALVSLLTTLQGLRAALAALRTTISGVTALERQLVHRDSPYADLLLDAHDQICPEGHVDTLEAWLSSVERAARVEQQALDDWRAAPDQAPW